MAEFNLIDERWIPCIDLRGKQVEHGIRETLLKAHALREICDDSPLVTVAIHRLLLAILYRAHDGPRDFTAWKSMYSLGGFDEQVVGCYLAQWKNRFDIFSDDRPFYQMGSLETRIPVPVNRLATECASGNNATLFDHSEDETGANWSQVQVARRLVACQSFALGFGKSGNARIGSVEETLPYSADAIALRGMNIWLQGTSLFETLSVNLVPIDDVSAPPWELEDSNAYRDILQDKSRKVVTSLGVVDRLTWQSRLIRLIPNGNTVSRIYYTQGRSADKSAGDPMKVYRTSKDEGISALSLSSGKAAWRDAHSILTIPSASSNERRPECFNLVARARSAAVVDIAKPFAVQIVGLATAPKKAGKFLLWRHERMPIPAALLSDVNLIERLGGLLQNAEQGAIEINTRIRRISKLYLSPSCESAGARQPDKNEVNKVVDAIDPRPVYWARLEKHFYTLLDTLHDDWDKKNDGWKPDDRQTATRTWREHVKREAQRALEESIRSLGTSARAIQAVARVRTDFNDDDLKPAAKKQRKAKRKGGKKE
ncbi:type I-E CRISPR-associated protein Cse1/CasA [Candidatus Bipolaricaulota bacterium]|nr:type I-E CRISPR-associated protein Cse1/CasA [Candidatus Bipolaricaulota bacterium]